MALQVTTTGITGQTTDRTIPAQQTTMMIGQMDQRIAATVPIKIIPIRAEIMTPGMITAIIRDQTTATTIAITTTATKGVIMILGVRTTVDLVQAITIETTTAPIRVATTMMTGVTVALAKTHGQTIMAIRIATTIPGTITAMTLGAIATAPIKIATTAAPTETRDLEIQTATETTITTRTTTAMIAGMVVVARNKIQEAMAAVSSSVCFYKI